MPAQWAAAFGRDNCGLVRHVHPNQIARDLYYSILLGSGCEADLLLPFAICFSYLQLQLQLQ